MLKLAKIIGSLITVLVLFVGSGIFPVNSPATADDGGEAGPGAIVLEPFTPIETGVIPKLDSQLSQMVEAQAHGRPQASAMEGQADMPEDQVMVVVECLPGQTDTAAQAASEFGVVEASYGDLLQMTVPVANLAALVNSPDVIRVRLPWRATEATIVVGEGVSRINADDWQASGYTGAGIKVGILDGGFQGYAGLLGQELPATVHTSWSEGVGVQGTSIHGTACAEVVYDIVPAAEFYFAQFATEVEMGNAVDWLKSKGVDIISCSMGFNLGGPGDGTGIVNDIVADARSSGITWVQAAGNNALSHWMGPFSDNGFGWHQFSGSSDWNAIAAFTGDHITLELKWDDPWGTSGNNYDLLLFYDEDEDNIL